MNLEAQSDKSTVRNVLTQAMGLLETLESEERQKVVRLLGMYVDLELPPIAGVTHRRNSEREEKSSEYTPKFTEDRTLSPKEFLFEKRPQTDVERIACLAYYLAHYRGTEHFKTLDLSKLNTEAAQIKFSNPAVAVGNAGKAGLLVPSQKGNQQLSAAGEMFVQALPDRVAAREKLADRKSTRLNSSH